MSAPDEVDDEAIVVGWANIWTTLLVSIVQGAAFYGFFKWKRGKDMELYNNEDAPNREEALDLYESRQHLRAHRAPKPFAHNWMMEAWNLSDEETLRCIGLDSYMFLRVLRLGARICTIGAALSVILLPVYATGDASGKATEQFNLLTLAKVEQGSSWRLWIALFAWWIFVAGVLHEFWNEWLLYYKNRSQFLSRGDPDSPIATRYAVRVEQVPTTYASDQALYKYFDRLFPGKIHQASTCLRIDEIEKLVQERQKNLIKYESVVAASHAKPDKPALQIKVNGQQVDALEHYQSEIDRLNSEIDEIRDRIISKTKINLQPTVEEDGGTNVILNEEQAVGATDETSNDLQTTTAFVTFCDLKSKQAAVQCELTGDPDSLTVFPATDPDSILWGNITVSLPRQKMLALYAAIFWMVGVLFWAVPVSFVTSIANLNSIIKSFGLEPVDPNVFWYGLVSGLLPVLALVILMQVLYIAITAVAMFFVRYKSLPEIDSYCMFWHMLFQFANLWLILIGGSLFNQIDVIIEDPNSFVDIIATALPGASTFFVNMILFSSFGACGLELSMISYYGLNLVMSLIKPRELMTQRELDTAKTPGKAPYLKWGQRAPPVVFIFLVAFLYMPIVPIIEIFGLTYFAVMYITWKHQMLHAYTPLTEGGGDSTWQAVFPFLIAGLYMGELVFIVYMGIKEAPAQGALGFVPFVITIFVHRALNRKFVAPGKNLSLEVAAVVDREDGELRKNFESIYLQSSLDPSKDEREPMPYRRELTPSLDLSKNGHEDMTNGQEASPLPISKDEKLSKDEYEPVTDGLESSPSPLFEDDEEIAC